VIASRLSNVALLKVKLKEGIDTSSLFGSHDAHLKMIEEALGIRVSARGEEVLLNGPMEAVRKGERLLGGLTGLMQEGFVLRRDDVEYAIRNLQGGEDPSQMKDDLRGGIEVGSGKRVIMPKTPTQRRYIEAIQKHDLVLGIGPAGTGKTYLAMAMAVASLSRREVNRIILARPAVEAGEKLGFLPGDMIAKVNPYLRPLYDALYDMMDLERANRLIERGDIEIAPLAFMRGRTLNDAFVILDEAQNATSEQMKMFLTRLGFNSKAVVTGDITQVDLPSDRVSGLIEVRDILIEVPGIAFIYFSDKDVVRHRLVQEIIKAYQRHHEKPTRPASRRSN
jgi:phosphate starvation-inducible protein PhoH and related proteins